MQQSSGRGVSYIKKGGNASCIPGSTESNAARVCSAGKNSNISSNQRVFSALFSCWGLSANRTAATDMSHVSQLISAEL